MNENLQAVVDLILQWGPAVASIVGMVTTIIVAIKKVNTSNKINLNETKKLADNTAQLMRENAELKRELRKILRKTYNIRDKGE